MFFFAACSALLAYLVRLPVRSFSFLSSLFTPSPSLIFHLFYQIPDKVLERHPSESSSTRNGETSSPRSPPSGEDTDAQKGQKTLVSRPRAMSTLSTLSTYEDGDVVMDPERGQTRSPSRS